MENKEIITPKYGLKCIYYTKTFDSIELLIQDIIDSGQDPHHKITKNGIDTGEEAIDYIVF